MGSRSIFSPNRDFVVIPTLINFLLALVVYALFSWNVGTDAHQPSGAFFGLFLIACSFVVSVWTFRSYFDEDVSDGVAWAAIFANAIILILVFASIHFGIGIVYAGAETANEASKIDFFDAVYFSIVTFTTLGYGDFQPSHELRIVTAIQAFLGYFYLGFFVASAHHYSMHFMDEKDLAGKGEKGDKGETGDKGEKGDKGDKGETGDPG